MVDGVVGGPATCRGLSDVGQAQAAALRDRFASGTEIDVDVVYSSPLPRARETTDIVLPALGSGNLEVHTHDELVSPGCTRAVTTMNRRGGEGWPWPWPSEGCCDNSEAVS